MTNQTVPFATRSHFPAVRLENEVAVAPIVEEVIFGFFRFVHRFAINNLGPHFLFQENGKGFPFLEWLKAMFLFPLFVLIIDYLCIVVNHFYYICSSANCSVFVVYNIRL